jgi:hypothetical protein
LTARSASRRGPTSLASVLVGAEAGSASRVGTALDAIAAATGVKVSRRDEDGTAVKAGVVVKAALGVNVGASIEVAV